MTRDVQDVRDNLETWFPARELVTPTQFLSGLAEEGYKTKTIIRGLVEYAIENLNSLPGPDANRAALIEQLQGIVTPLDDISKAKSITDKLKVLAGLKAKEKLENLLGSAEKWVSNTSTHNSGDIKCCVALGILLRQVVGELPTDSSLSDRAFRRGISATTGIDIKKTEQQINLLVENLDSLASQLEEQQQRQSVGSSDGFSTGTAVSINKDENESSSVTVSDKTCHADDNLQQSSSAKDDYSDKTNSDLDEQESQKTTSTLHSHLSISSKTANDKVKETQGLVSVLEEEVITIAADLAAINDNISTLLNDLSRLTEEVSRAEGDFSQLNEQVSNQFTNKVPNLLRSLTGQPTKLSESPILEQKKSKLLDQQDQLSDKQELLKENEAIHEALSSSLETCQTKLSEARNNLEVERKIAQEALERESQSLLLSNKTEKESHSTTPDNKKSHRGRLVKGAMKILGVEKLYKSRMAKLKEQHSPEENKKDKNNDDLSQNSGVQFKN